MWLILVLIILTIVYYLIQKQYDYWKDRGVPGPKPTFFVGNVGASLIGKKALGDIYRDIYKKFEGYSIVGIYRMGTPCLLIREPECIKHMVIKDFKNFHDNDIDIDKNIDRLFGRNPFALKGAEWKQKRAQLSVCFSSGKIKSMFPSLEEASRQMVKYIEKENETSSTSLESKEVCVRFTLNNVAACAFGVDGKCFIEPNSEFRQLADDFISPGTWASIKIFIFMIFPQFNKFFKMSIVERRVEDKLIDIVKGSLKYRKDNNIIRNDFLESVNQIYKDLDLVDQELETTAQAAAFFADGYETSSRVMSFLVYEIAKNPDVQQKLREEVNKICAKYDNQITYDGIQEMKYLDACLNENLRKYPIIAQLAKVCTEKYTYTPTDPEYKKISVTIEPGTPILLPIGALQNDERYFEFPEKFMPERFLDKEKEKINKFAFLPFGEGPRSCLGFRFGVTQIKLGMAQLVRNFEMKVNNKTKEPLKFDPWFIMMSPIGGLWIDFKKIK